MKKSTESFIYEHVTKLPWIGAVLWTALMTWAFQFWPLENYLYSFTRHFLFGLSWVFLWFILDDRIATRFRRKVLLSTPGLREACIQGILEDAGVLSTEAIAEEDED